jgi:hypothetical protein
MVLSISAMVAGQKTLPKPANFGEIILNRNVLPYNIAPFGMVCTSAVVIADYPPDVSCFRLFPKIVSTNCPFSFGKSALQRIELTF